MSDFLIESYEEIFQDITEELVILYNYSQTVGSNVLKELLIKSYNLGANTHLNFHIVWELYAKYCKLENEFLDIYLKSIINLDDFFICELEQKKITKNKAKLNILISDNMHTLYKDYCAIFDLNQSVLLNTVNLSLYNNYLALVVNDHNKSKTIKERIASLSKSIMGQIPFVSEVFGAVETVKDIALFSEMFDTDSITDDFFTLTDNNLSKIEHQNECLNLVANEQAELIENLKQLCKKSEQKIKKLKESCQRQF